MDADQMQTGRKIHVLFYIINLIFSLALSETCSKELWINVLKWECQKACAADWSMRRVP